ncbi:MAG: hypothetical protein M1830_002608 [Pleopsidium flavum]|nr:MAG: hypothetical protein M1830_002608 [Pleopsidium flavum]
MPYTLKGRNVLVTGGSRYPVPLTFPPFPLPHPSTPPHNLYFIHKNPELTSCSDGDRGLGALVSSKFASEGCNISINYVTNVERAKATAEKIERDYNVKTMIIQGGWTKFSAFGDLHALSEEDWDKCWAVNCKGNMHLLREALPTFNANSDGGVFLMTSSIAGVAVSGSTMAYSVSKAAGLHLMRCLAQTQGPKIRVNAILPGLLLTEWGSQFSPERIKQMEDKAVLKKVTNLEDCADAFVAAAKNSSMTGQKIQIDAGLVI